MPAAERAGRDVIRKGNLMKGKMPGKLAALLLTAALCVAGTLLPMNANAATQLTVKDALLIIYSDKSNCGDTAYKSVRSGLKSAASGDILAGRYTKNAVAAFLDHGYFADSYSDFLEKGLLPDGYRLPEKTYQVTRTQDPVNYSRSGGLLFITASRRQRSMRSSFRTLIPNMCRNISGIRNKRTRRSLRMPERTLIHRRQNRQNRP